MIGGANSRRCWMSQKETRRVMTLYAVWDDAAGVQLTHGMPEDEAKSYALDKDPVGERLFLEDEDGNQLGWNPNLDPPRWEPI